MSGIKQSLQTHLINNMIKKARGNSDDYVVLVVDKYTTKILSSCARMYDIMEAGVLVLENLALEREKLTLSAVYFISNTEESVNRVIQDFAKKPQYASVHLYFTGHVNPTLMSSIGQATKLVKRIKTFQEINVDFLAVEARAFTFGRTNNVISNLYCSTKDVLEKELSQTSAQLTSLLLTLKEFPHIRYYAKGQRGLCKGLATFLAEDLNKRITQLKDWKYNETRARGTLLIVDRAMDPVAPLMHEYTYQAMVNDLLKVKGEICTLPSAPSREEKEDGSDKLVLSEDDSLWTEMRHHHIGQVLHDVNQKFKDFRGTNKMAQFRSDTENASLKDMLAGMKEMPQYKEMMKKYTKHVSLAEACMGKFDSKSLKDLGELEQDMATGLTDDGEKVVEKTMKEALVTMCQNAEIGVLDKLRLLMIYLISQGGMAESTRKELMKPIDLGLHSAVINLEKLGVSLANRKKGRAPKHSKSRLAEFSKRAKTIPMALMRYVPILHQVISDLVGYTLSEEDFPYTSPPPGDHGKKKAKAKTRGPRNWRSDKNKDENKEDTRPLFIIYVLGGVTYSEMRSMYEIGDQMKVNVLIGSTSILRPSGFIRQLGRLNTKQFKKMVEASTGKLDADELPDVNPLDADDDSDLSDVDVD